MKQTMKKTAALLLSLSLLLTLLFTFCSCKEEVKPTETPTLSTDAPTDGSDEKTDESAEKELTGVWKNALYQEDVTLGEGAKTVQIEVTAEGHSITVTVKTDEEILGRALLSLGLNEGEEGPYGLYIKRVNGIKADYDEDQSYWAFYQNGEYMMTGVDSTEIKGGEHFELVKSK